jgi:hypothetical protein
LQQNSVTFLLEVVQKVTGQVKVWQESSKNEAECFPSPNARNKHDAPASEFLRGRPVAGAPNSYPLEVHRDLPSTPKS